MGLEQDIISNAIVISWNLVSRRRFENWDRGISDSIRLSVQCRISNTRKEGSKSILMMRRKDLWIRRNILIRQWLFWLFQLMIIEAKIWWIFSQRLGPLLGFQRPETTGKDMVQTFYYWFAQIVRKFSTKCTIFYIFGLSICAEVFDCCRYRNIDDSYYSVNGYFSGIWQRSLVLHNKTSLLALLFWKKLLDHLLCSLLVAIDTFYQMIWSWWVWNTLWKI